MATSHDNVIGCQNLCTSRVMIRDFSLLSLGSAPATT